MHVRVRLDGAEPRRWQIALLQRIADIPGIRAVSVDAAALPDGWPDTIELLFRLEALIHGLPRLGSERLPPTALNPWRRPDANPDLVLDLCGDLPSGPAVWQIAYDDRLGDGALMASLLAGAVPRLTLIEAGKILAAGRLGTDRPGILLAGVDDALARTVTLVVAALDRRAAGASAPVSAAPVPPSEPGRTLSGTELGRRTARMLAGAVVHRLYHLCYRAPHWRCGWRRLDGPDLIDLGRHPETGWNTLPDDGHRFYADPFPLAFAGNTHVFVEEFPHATGKAIISAVRFGPHGPEGTPVPVLEEAHHLSYPFVFERDGEAWMVPESSASGTVDLYRATRYPGGWVKEATLLTGVVASDATLLERDGRWWIFATSRDTGPNALAGSGSYHDALCLWSAPDFRGPYTPHPANPVLIDPATARPAGRIVERGGRLIRPVQDCAQGYGRALGLARIDRLDPEGFAQTLIGRVEPGPSWSGSRLHTLNTGGGLECIDGSARAPRIRIPRRA